MLFFTILIYKCKSLFLYFLMVNLCDHLVMENFHYTSIVQNQFVVLSLTFLITSDMHDTSLNWALISIYCVERKYIVRNLKLARPNSSLIMRNC